MEKIYQWKKYVLYTCIGFVSGVISSYGIWEGISLFYKPALVFYIANMIIFHDIFLRDISKSIILLLTFWVIYLTTTFTLGFITPLSMPLGGILTLFSYSIVGIKVKNKDIILNMVLLCLIGVLFLILASYKIILPLGGFEHFQSDNTIRDFFPINIVSVWQTVIFTTAAISAQGLTEDKILEDEN